MNLVTLADENLRNFGEYPFIIFEDATFTNRQMINQASGLADGLKSLGVKKGDNVVVMLPNCPEVLISYQGILRCGAVIVPLIPLVNERELIHILGNCEATAMITTGDIFQKNKTMLRTIKLLKNIILMDNDSSAGTFPFWSLIRDHSETPDLPAIGEEDLAVILYTAGTTSTPKGVILTHKNLYSNAVNAARAHGTQATDITLIALPLSHSFGITSMNKAYTYGNLHVLMRKFQVEEAFKLIEKYKVTDFPGVPAMFITMLNSPDAERYDLSSWKSCLSGAAPFPVANLLAFQKRFNCTVFEAYGLSEASPAVSTNYYNRPTKPGSIGQPIPEVARYGSWMIKIRMSLRGKSGNYWSKVPTFRWAITSCPKRLRRRSDMNGCTPATWRKWTKRVTCTLWKEKRTSSSVAVLMFTPMILRKSFINIQPSRTQWPSAFRLR